MKFYKCDVCGRTIQPHDSLANFGEVKTRYSGLFGAIIDGKDVCSRCMEVGSRLGVEKTFMKIWQKVVDSANDDGVEESTEVNILSPDVASPAWAFVDAKRSGGSEK